jgi:membrane protein required for colicin V production
MIKALDIFLLFLLAWGGYSGFRKGFILELFSIASLFIATIGSIKLLNKFIGLYSKWWGDLGTWMPYLLFIILFIFLVLIVSLVGRLLKKLVHHLTPLGSLDCLIGAALGVFKWAFLISSMLWVIHLLHLKLPNRYTDHTTLFPIIQALVPKLMGFFPHWLPTLKNWLRYTNQPGHQNQVV